MLKGNKDLCAFEDTGAIKGPPRILASQPGVPWLPNGQCECNQESRFRRTHYPLTAVLAGEPDALSPASFVPGDLPHTAPSRAASEKPASLPREYAAR